MNIIPFQKYDYLLLFFQQESLHSYWHFMHAHLFDHIDIDKKNIHIPDGTIQKETIEQFCEHYEEMIE